MAAVKHKILVLSGKGGVGKSTFSAQLSFALAAMDFQVGILDIDICGPSIPKMLGLEGQEIHQSNIGWSPVYVDSNLGVMSIGFMLPNPDEAVIWRGPRKNGDKVLAQDAFEKKENEKMEEPSVSGPATSRPKRNRKAPEKMKDYVSY